MCDHKELLSDFLNTPIDRADPILDRFAALENAVAVSGTEPLQRFVYIPGSRKDRVLLVAHTDTVWDRQYDKPYSGEQVIQFKDGAFLSGNPTCGIGADDRAGCAMLWALRSCGHSLLLVDGEEHGKCGARYLRQHHPKLFRELNQHCYMIELDWQGTDGCLFNQVDNTKSFKTYIENTLGFRDSNAKGGTDLQILCRDVCGVNIGIGYRGCHTHREYLLLSEWEHTLEKLSVFLQQPQRRFPTKKLVRCIRFAKQCAKKVLQFLSFRLHTL